MSAEQVAVIPQCVECGEFWLPVDKGRWRAYLDTANEVVIFCVECAEWEFEARG